MELSLKTPVAVNCCVRPFGRLGLGGVTWMETRVAAVTVRFTLGEATPLRWALMCTEPTPVPVARPLEPAALLIVAIDASDEVHVTCEVRFCFE